jgi:hypothetical protein
LCWPQAAFEAEAAELTKGQLGNTVQSSYWDAQARAPKAQFVLAYHVNRMAAVYVSHRIKKIKS